MKTLFWRIAIRSQFQYNGELWLKISARRAMAADGSQRPFNDNQEVYCVAANSLVGK